MTTETDQDDYDKALLQAKAQEQREYLSEREQQLPAAKKAVIALLTVVRDASMNNSNDTEKWLFEQAIKAVKGAR